MTYNTPLSLMPILEQHRHKKGRVSRVDKEADHLLNMAEVSYRWGCTPTAAKRRLIANGVVLVEFSPRSRQAWFSDVRRIEAKFSTVPSESTTA
jgi:hypothetical protein